MTTTATVEAQAGPAIRRSRAGGDRLGRCPGAERDGYGASLSRRPVLPDPVAALSTPTWSGTWIPKSSPQSVARAIFDGVDNGEEDISPDPMSRTIADSWRSGLAKALERQNAALLQAQPATS